jgi:uncharacterized protein (DUF433 family)
MKMKLDFVNDGKEFELPKLTVEDEIAVLEYVQDNTKENDSETKKRYIEYAYSVYRILNKIDKNITFEQIMQTFSIEELMGWYFRIRLRGNKIYSCPHCKEKISFWELIEDVNQGRDKNFRKKNITGTN